MVNKNQKSNFPYSYEEVDQLGVSTHSMMERDAAQFSLFGIDQTAIDNFKALSDSFNQRDFDEKYVLLQKAKTFAKDELAEEIRLEIYDLQLQEEWVWKKYKQEYKTLNLGSVSKDSDLELAVKARLCISVYSDNLDVLTEAGLTAERLAALGEKLANFKQLIDQQKLAEHNRHVAQSKRVSLANELYAEIVKYRNLGRKMWATKDYELSQSYVMPKKYPSSSGADPDPDVSAVDSSTDENALS